MILINKVLEVSLSELGAGSDRMSEFVVIMYKFLSCLTLNLEFHNLLCTDPAIWTIAGEERGFMNCDTLDASP